MKICSFLSLRGRYFFHVYPGHSFPARVRVSRFQTSTVADPESHAHHALVEFLADSFDLSNTVQIFFPACSMLHEHDSIDGCWSRALCTVEGEIPTPAAEVAVCDAQSAIPENTKGCFVRHFLENTFLEKRIIRIKKLAIDQFYNEWEAVGSLRGQGVHEKIFKNRNQCAYNSNSLPFLPIETSG